MNEKEALFCEYSGEDDDGSSGCHIYNIETYQSERTIRTINNHYLGFVRIISGMTRPEVVLNE